MDLPVNTDALPLKVDLRKVTPKKRCLTRSVAWLFVTAAATAGLLAYFVFTGTEDTLTVQFREYGDGSNCIAASSSQALGDMLEAYAKEEVAPVVAARVNQFLLDHAANTTPPSYPIVLSQTGVEVSSFNCSDVSSPPSNPESAPFGLICGTSYAMTLSNISIVDFALPASAGEALIPDEASWRSINFNALSSWKVEYAIAVMSGVGFRDVNNQFLTTFCGSNYSGPFNFSGEYCDA